MLRAFQSRPGVAVTALASVPAAVLAAIAGAAVLRAQAQPLDVKLGLWEMTVTSQMSGLPPMPPIDTSKMTPEQRARVEAMLAARGNSANSPGTPRVVKDCITKEKLDKEAFQVNQRNDSSCKQTVASSTSKLQVIRVACTDNRKMSGEMLIEVPSPEKVQVTSKMTSGDGANPMVINVSGSGRWLSSACGDVK